MSNDPFVLLVGGFMVGVGIASIAFKLTMDHMERYYEGRIDYWHNCYMEMLRKSNDQEPSKEQDPADWWKKD